MTYLAEAAFCFAGFVAVIAVAWTLYTEEGWRL